jgi:hypothetical protein
MMQRASALAFVCVVSAAVRAQPVVETASVPREEAKGLNLLISGMAAPDDGATPFGFLLGGGFESRVGRGVDLNAGMSFQRFGSVNGPVTVVSLLDVTAARRAPSAVFFGAGLGPVFALGKARPGGRVFAGVELLHQSPLAIQMALELVFKFCTENDSLACPAGERQTWLAGRIGFRL